MASSYGVSKGKGYGYEQGEIFTPFSTGSSFPGWSLPSNRDEQVFPPPLGNKNDETLVLESSLTRDSPSEHQDTYDHIQTWNFSKTQNHDSHPQGHHLDFGKNLRPHQNVNEGHQIHAKHKNSYSNYSNELNHHFESRNIKFSDCQGNDVINSSRDVLEEPRNWKKATLLERSEKINKELLSFFHTCLWKPENMTLNLFETVSQLKVEEKNFEEPEIGNKNEEKMENFWERSTIENSENSFENCKNEAKESIIKNKKFFKESEWIKLMAILQDIILNNNNAAKRLWNYINGFTGNKKLKKGKKIFKILNCLGLEEVFDELIEEEKEEKMKKKQKSNETKSLIFDLVQRI